MSVLTKPYTDAKADARIALHVASPTSHQDIRNLTGIHAALTTGIHGVGSLHIAGFHAQGQEVSMVRWFAASKTPLVDSNRTVSLDWTELYLPNVSASAKYAILQLRLVTDTVGAGSYSSLRIRKKGDTPTYSPELRVYHDFAANGNKFF